MNPIIYLNGYPGVRKFTIAKELVKKIPNSKLIDNHLLIDPINAIYDRSDNEYQESRMLLRKTIFDIIKKSKSNNENMKV